MVKKKTGGSKLRHKYERSKGDIEEGSSGRVSEAIETVAAGNVPPQKLQRKITKRVNFFERVAESSLGAKPTIKKKRRRKAAGPALGDLSSLSDALAIAEKEAVHAKQELKKGLGLGGAKARRKITTQETVRLQQVLAHPEFKRDPLAAVAQHLSSTLPAVEPPKTTRKNMSGSQKQKLKRKKARLESETNL